MGCCFSSLGIAGEPPPPGDGNWARTPFIAASAHHRPIGSGAVFASGSHPFIANWATVTSMNINVGSPFGRTLHEVYADSPRVTIARVPVTENNYFQVPVSNIAYPAEGVVFKGNVQKNDNVVVFIDGTTGEHCEFRECGPGNTTFPPSNPFLAGSFRRSWAKTNGNANVGVTSGLGHGLSDGDRVGHSAGGVAAAFGVTQGWELTSSTPIGHVLQLVVPGTPTGSDNAGSAQLASRLKVLPATNVDGYINNAGNGQGTIPYGGVLSLPHGFDLGTFSSLNTLQMKIVMAVNDYGLLMVDTGGLVGPRVAQDVTGAQATQIRAALNAMRPHLRLITNCAWDPNNRLLPTGGGTPRAANRANDA